MLTFITEFFSLVSGVINSVGQTLDDLVNAIDAVNFSSESAIYKFFGAIKFLEGNIAYTYTVLIIQAGASFLIYKLVCVLVDVVTSAFSNLKGKLIFR